MLQNRIFGVNIYTANVSRDPRRVQFKAASNRLTVVMVVLLALGVTANGPTATGATRPTTKSTKANRRTKANAKTSPTSGTTIPAKSVVGPTKSLDAATVAAARGEVLVRTPAKGEPYPIGLLVERLSEQPVVAEVAAEQQRGAELAVAFVNELGGIGGRPVALAIANEGGTSESAKKGFEGLVRQGVHAVIGPTVSKHVRAVAASAERDTTLLFSASASANGVSALSPWVRRSAFPPDVISSATVAELVSTKASSTATIVWPSFADGSSAGTGSGAVIAASYRRAFGKMGIAVEDVELRSSAEIESSAGDVARKRSDVIVVVGSPIVAAAFVSATIRAGSSAVVVVDPSALSKEFVARCSPCAGVITPLVFDTEDVTSYSRALLLRRYFDKYGSLPTASAAQGFAAVQILAIALDAAIAGESTPQSLSVRRDALRREVTAGRYDTPFGLITFDSQGEVKLDRVALGEIVQGGAEPRIRALPQVPTSILTS
jgi:branched-chain amino acid transport system substrate-binding protein